MTDTRLTVQGLAIDYPAARVVNNLSFTLGNERLALVGESGSGKSMTARALMGLVRKPGTVSADTLNVLGRNVLTLNDRGWRDLRGNDIAMVLQDPRYALNPVKNIQAQLEEALTLHQRLNRRARLEAVKAAVAIPVVANGDINSPQKAAAVRAATGADALMIGRAAMGRPWLFREIAHYLQTGELLPPPTVAEAHAALQHHLQDHYALYGEYTGVRSARKHIGWYAASLPDGDALRQHINGTESADAQMRAIDVFFTQLQTEHARLPTLTPTADAADADQADLLAA